MDLLGGSSSDSDSDTNEDLLNTNNDYASNYDKWRGKEHLQKLKDKHGDQSIDMDEEDEDEDDSTSEEEDEEGDEITADIEKDFFATLSSLKSKDPAIYDGKTSFFKEQQQTETKSKAEKKEKVTIADMERKVMLERGGQFEEIEDINEADRVVTHTEEMRTLKDSFKTALESDEEDEEEESFLTKRKKNKQEVAEEEKDYKKWLAGQKVEVADDSLKEKMKGLRDYWNVDNLDEGEKFLKDYILNKRYLDNDNEEYVPSYDDIVHDSDEDLSEDEKNVEKQEEFEHKFNFRFEEPDEDFIKRYPRTIKDSLRKTDDKRKLKRKEVEERKKHEKEVKREEIKMLKSMKKKEIMQKLEQLKKITGNEEMDLDEDDIEGDFDPEKYDKKMAEIFKNYDDNVEDDEKPSFSDLEDEYEDEYGDDFEDWDNWTGSNQENNAPEDQGEEQGPHCEDEDFNMDCEFQEEMVESTKKKKGRRKSKFAQALEDTSSKPVFDPSDKTFSEYVDEYYKLDCEDMIGDVACRFQYRSVQPNDFGLSVEEVLGAQDKELNAWASLRKTCQYRPEEEERKDFHVYRNKSKDSKLKKKLMPSLYEEPEAAPEASGSDKTAVSNNKKRRRGKKETGQTPASTAVSGEASVEPPAKKTKSESETVSKDASSSSSQSVGNNSNKKRKKKKKKSQSNSQPQTSSVIQVNKISAAFATKKPVNREKNSSQKQEGNLLKFSDERLKAYGVNPSQFKRKARSERFKQQAAKQNS